MADTITFRGAVIRDFDVRMSTEGDAVFCRIHMSADFTDVVRAFFEWDDLPGGYTDAVLKGELVGVQMEVKPSGRELAKYAFELPIREVSDFKVISLKQPDEKPDVKELRFVIRTNAKRAYNTLGTYIENIGRGKSQLKVAYSRQETFQDAIPDDVKASEDQRQATLATAD